MAAAVRRSASPLAAITCSWIVLALELAAALSVGCESTIFARFVSEPAAALPAGCKFASFALEFDATCFAIMACAAGFDLSPRVAVTRWAISFDELSPDAGCTGLDDTSRDEATATPSPT